MIKRRIYLICSVVFVAFISTSTLKVYVKSFESQLESTENKNDLLKGEVQVLRAELAHLSNADRIGQLAKQHLNLDKVRSNQVHYLATQTDEASEKAAMKDDVVNVLPATKWRYKSRDHIMKVSLKR